ncbi:hypothetical protein HD806DRAFT_369384 [Xylariaceae sp. AK1471]|nr:hypothetical protein HD806DRAFT_369384 [Xylariaceae sp. AK1471]
MSSTNSNSPPIDKDYQDVLSATDVLTIDRQWILKGGTGLERPQIEAVLKDLEYENERIKREIFQPMRRDENSKKLAKFISHITPVICYAQRRLDRQLRVALTEPVTEHATEPPQILVTAIPPLEPPVPQLLYQIAKWSLNTILDGYMSTDRSIRPKKVVMCWDLGTADGLSGQIFNPNDDQLGDFDLAGSIQAFGFDDYQSKTIDLGIFDSS